MKNKYLKKDVDSDGGTVSNKKIKLDMKDLLDDDIDQIVISNSLFDAFNRSSKSKRYYEKDKALYLFKYVCLLYNDTMQASDKFGALTYLEKISNCLDYLKIANIVELSLEQINIILESDEKDIATTYNYILSKRHIIDSSDYAMYVKMLKNHNKYNSKLAFKVYSHISNIYNANTILQDNIEYTSFLDSMASIKQEEVLSMRMYQILEIFKLHSINYENVNESKKLLNDFKNTSYSTI